MAYCAQRNKNSGEWTPSESAEFLRSPQWNSDIQIVPRVRSTSDECTSAHRSPTSPSGHILRQPFRCGA